MMGDFSRILKFWMAVYYCYGHPILLDHRPGKSFFSQAHDILQLQQPQSASKRIKILARIGHGYPERGQEISRPNPRKLPGFSRSIR
jgi:hypothetical protein